MNKLLFLLIIIICISCKPKDYTNGIFQTKDKKLSAWIIDSTLHVMTAKDTMVIYNLRIHFDSDKKYGDMRVYNVLFCHTLNMEGYESFYVPLHYKYDSIYGGALTLDFFGHDIFFLGGSYKFYRQKNPKESENILLSFLSLMKNNYETKTISEYEDN